MIINMEQSFLHTHCSTVSLTPFRTGAVPDRESPGWFPTSPGITGLRLSHPAGRCALTGHSRGADMAQNWLPPTTPAIRLPDTPEPLSLHAHSQSRVHKYVRVFTILMLCTSGLSPYCCSTPNRTIHKQVSTWTSLSSHRTQYPNTCISIQTTCFTC